MADTTTYSGAMKTRYPTSMSKAKLAQFAMQSGTPGEGTDEASPAAKRAAAKRAAAKRKKRLKK